MRTIYRIALCGFAITMMLIGCPFLTVSAASAENNGKVLELEKGEQLLLPDKGEIQITDKNVVSTSSGGNVQALTEGETEIVVRYRIRVKKTAESVKNEVQSPEQKTENQESQDSTEGNEEETGGKKETADMNGTENAEQWEDNKDLDNKKNTDSAKDEKKDETNTGSSIPKEETGAGREENQAGEIVPKEPETPEDKMVEIEIPDREYPVIQMENLPKLSANQTAVTPVLLIRDANLNRESIKISLCGERLGNQDTGYEKAEVSEGVRVTLNPITEDDEYVLICEADDTYGNKTKQRWVFSVNQGGTTFVYGHESRTQTGLFSPEIGLENVDAVEVLDCLVNGEPVPYIWKDGKIKIAEENLKNGKNRISISVRDAAGNITDMEPWDFILEKTVEDELTAETQEEVRAGESTPLGMIFLLIGGIFVFWEKKMCYNGSRDFISENKGRNYERHGTQISGAPFRIVSNNRKSSYRDYQSPVHFESAKGNRTFSDRYPRGVRGIFTCVKEWLRLCEKEDK